LGEIKKGPMAKKTETSDPLRRVRREQFAANGIEMDNLL
jgi:hypothetical protein